MMPPSVQAQFGGVLAKYIAAWGWPPDAKRTEEHTQRLHDFLLEPFALLPFHPKEGLGGPFERYAVAMLLALELATAVPAREPPEE